MLVDDQELWRAAVRRPLEAAGIDVVAEASDVREARAAALRHRPDVILLDRQVAGVRGIHLIDELTPLLPHTRIVILSASTQDRDIIEALASGAFGYLFKDIPQDALVRAVRDVGAGYLAMSRSTAATALRHFVTLAQGRPAALTPRQRQILRGVAEGLTNVEIAARLTISSRTVEGHVAAIIRKMNARDRTDAVKRYSEEKEPTLRPRDGTPFRSGSRMARPPTNAATDRPGGTT